MRIVIDGYSGALQVLVRRGCFPRTREGGGAISVAGRVGADFA
jgi:hypothetical protein